MSQKARSFALHVAKDLREQMRARIDDRAFQNLVDDLRFRSFVGQRLAACSGYSDGTGGHCTLHCTGDLATGGSTGSGTLVSSCSFSDAYEYTCSGTTYTASHGTYLLNLVMSGGSSLAITMNMAADIAGGSLGGKVECGFHFNLNFGTMTGENISCDNFSCSYAGKEISCEQMQQSFGRCS
jgi:hypothetical protein